MSHVRRAVACIVMLTAALCIPTLTAGAAAPTLVANAVAYLSATPPQNAGTTPATIWFAQGCACAILVSREAKRPRPIGATHLAHRCDQADTHVISVAVGRHLAADRDAGLPVAARQFELAHE